MHSLPSSVLMQLYGNFQGVKFAGATPILVTFVIFICESFRGKYLSPREHEGTERETEGVGCDMS